MWISSCARNQNKTQSTDAMSYLERAWNMRSNSLNKRLNVSSATKIKTKNLQARVLLKYFEYQNTNTCKEGKIQFSGFFFPKHHRPKFRIWKSYTIIRVHVLAVPTRERKKAWQAGSYHEVTPQNYLEHTARQSSHEQIMILPSFHTNRKLIQQLIQEFKEKVIWLTQRTYRNLDDNYFKVEISNQEGYWDVLRIHTKMLLGDQTWWCW